MTRKRREESERREIAETDLRLISFYSCHPAMGQQHLDKGNEMKREVKSF